MMINSTRKIPCSGIALLALLYYNPLHAQQYVPPPAGPYKPEVVVSDAPAFSFDNAGKVYKFPSEDLIRSEAPPELSLPTAARPGQGSKRENSMPSTQRPHDVQNPTGFNPATPAQTQDGSMQTPQPTAGRNYSANPWAPSPSAQPSQPGYPAASGWYPPQYGYGGYPQQYPYGYGAQDYYGNTQNDANAPFSNMPSPWNMMPMQPFFPDR